MKLRKGHSIADLADRGARLTVEIGKLDADHDRLARERAEVWVEALAAGATQTLLAEKAGLHHSQIGKALRRYAS